MFSKDFSFVPENSFGQTESFIVNPPRNFWLKIWKNLSIFQRKNIEVFRRTVFHESSTEMIREVLSNFYNFIFGPMVSRLSPLQKKLKIEPSLSILLQFLLFYMTLV